MAAAATLSAGGNPKVRLQLGDIAANRSDADPESPCDPLVLRANRHQLEHPRRAGLTAHRGSVYANIGVCLRPEVVE